MNVEKLDESEINPNALVHCPKVGGILRPCIKCVTDQKPSGESGCEFLLGFGDINPEHPDFSIRYRLVCVHPIARQIAMISEE